MTTPEPPDYRHFDIQGSHANLGTQLGMADGPFTRQPWWAHTADLHMTRECARVVHDWHPQLIEEIAAYADAQQIMFDSLWQVCCRVDLKARLRAQAVDAEGCSSFAYAIGTSMLIGRNYDYWPLQTRRQRIRFTSVTSAGASESRPFASIGARGGVPCGRYDGMNEHGVFIALHVVMTDSPAPAEIQPGIPFHLVSRIILEHSASAAAACDLLIRMPHLSSLNYLVADAHHAFVVEADPRAVRLRPLTTDQIAAATNHFEHPDMRRFAGRRITENSCRRLDYLLQPCMLPRATRDQTTDGLLDHAQRILADRTVPICGKSGALTTLWACVAELSTRTIRYCAGAPGDAPFEPCLAPAIIDPLTA